MTGQDYEAACAWLLGEREIAGLGGTADRQPPRMGSISTGSGTQGTPSAQSVERTGYSCMLKGGCSMACGQRCNTTFGFALLLHCLLAVIHEAYNDS